MRVVCVNYAYDIELATPEALLGRYETLVGWAEAIASSGWNVSVVQRFAYDATVTWNGILYQFVNDKAGKHGGILDSPLRVHCAVAALKPDLVHVNGLQFGRQARQLKEVLAAAAPVLVQDHANLPPRRILNRCTLRAALRTMDAFSFVSREQAGPWLQAGLLRPEQPIFELMEGSSRFQLKSRELARARTGLTGSPQCLWVGRLNENKDPITVLDGFRKALPEIPNAHLVMVYSTEDLLAHIKQRLVEDPVIARRISLLGRKPHDALEDIYNSADLFVSGSHHEGSGFAVLEALACGVAPVLTDIPSFRVLTGRAAVGALWSVGDADALGRSLVEAARRLHPRTRQDVRAFFEANFSWDAIGVQAVEAYRRMLEQASSLRTHAQ